ncbi:MAG: RHS repeat-associated core domain-containing protein, partial [Pseudobdellovibrio sp.]
YNSNGTGGVHILCVSEPEIPTACNFGDTSIFIENAFNPGSNQVKPPPKDPNQKDIFPKACGSVINFNDQTVAEQIDVDGADFYLNYSSKFNDLTTVNHSFKIQSPYLTQPDLLGRYDKLTLQLENGVSQTAVYNSNTGAFEVQHMPVSDQSVFSYVWDGNSGNSSSNIFASRLRYRIFFQRAFPSGPLVVSASPDLFVTYQNIIAMAPSFMIGADPKLHPSNYRIVQDPPTINFPSSFTLDGLNNQNTYGGLLLSAPTGAYSLTYYNRALSDSEKSNYAAQSDTVVQNIDIATGFLDSNNNPLMASTTTVYQNAGDQYYQSIDGHLTIYHPQVWGLNGWTPSILHYLDIDSRVLYMGTGDVEKYDHILSYIDPETSQPVYYVPNKSNSDEYFVFDSNGRHLYTKSLYLPNKNIYKFDYDTSFKLTKIETRNGRYTQFVYDQNGNLSQIIAPYGQQSNVVVQNNQLMLFKNSQLKQFQMQYDQQNLLTSFQKLDGTITTFSYDANGNFQTENKNTGLSQTISNIFSGQSNTISVIADWGQKLKRIAGYVNGNLTVTDYDKDQNAISTATVQDYQFVSQQLQNTETRQDQNHPLWSTDVVDPLWVQTQLNSTLGSSNFILNYTYNYNINTPSNAAPFYNQKVTVSTYAGGFEHAYADNFSNDTHTLIIENVGSTRKVLTLDPNNYTVTHIEETTQKPIDLQYNTDLQLIRKTQGLLVEDYTYDQYGYLASVSNTLGQITTFVNDSQGKVLVKTLPNQEQIKFEYTDAGELKKITTPSNQVHNFQFSLGDYLSSYLTPDNKNTQYNYDSHKRLIQIQKPSGATITYNYENGTNRLSQIQTPTGNYTVNQYDVASKPLSVTSPDNIKLDYIYFGDQPQKQTWYDSDGSLIGSVQIDLKSNVPFLDKISINNSVIATVDYDSNQLRISRIGPEYYSNNPDHGWSTGVETAAFNSNFGVTYTHDFTSNQHITNMQSYNAGQLSNVVLTRIIDDAGLSRDYTQVSSVQPPLTYNSYTNSSPQYDSNNRLISVERTSSSYVNGQLIGSLDFINEYAYPFGSNNNMNQFTQTTYVPESPIKRTVATYSPDDKLLSLSGSMNRTYTYTDDGNIKTLTNCTGTTTYTYDVFGNIKQVVFPNGKTVSYQVDAQNRRVKKFINGAVFEYYLWYDQIHLAAVLNPDKSVKLQYLYNLEQNNSPTMVIKAGVTYKLIADPVLGSVRYVYASDGTKMQEIEYDEYGNILNNSNPSFQPILFAGGLYDFDTKLYRFGARDYDPTIGRWTTKDPIGFAGGDTNLYAYVSGNPMSRTDTKGTGPLASYICGQVTSSLP